MDGDSQRLASLQPLMVQRWLVDDSAPRSRTTDATVVSADISGFTRLAEQLSHLGVRRAAESLNDAISLCFEPMIDEVIRRGGDVLKFGGDAIFAIFEGADAASRAASASSKMMEVLRQVDLDLDTHDPETRLSMTVGVATGPVSLLLAGDERRELVVHGATVDECLRLEGSAEPGEVLICDTTSESLPPSWYENVEDGVLALVGLDDRDPDPGLLADQAVAVDGPMLGIALGADLAAAVEALAGTAGEIRVMTVAFVFLPTGGLENDAIVSVIDRAIELCSRYGSTLLSTDVSPGGVKMLFTAGAPLATDGDEDAMLGTMSDLVLTTEGPPLRAGVNRGLAYIGFLGSSRRQALTVMGDPINLGARLLGKAEDRSVAVSQAVLDHARTGYETTELAPILVKGRVEPVTIHRLGRPHGIHSRSYRPRFVGRDKEMALLGSALDEARGGLGSVVDIVGEAGVGASRLVEEFRDSLPAGVLCFGLRGGIAERAKPYRAASPFLRALAGIDEDADPDEASPLLRRWVERVNAQMVDRLPVLAPAFLAAIEGEAAADPTLPEFRQDRANKAILDLLQTVLTVPAVIVVEDLQWVDPGSVALMESLAAACPDRPWLIITTARPGGHTLGEAESGIALRPLDGASTESIVAEVADLPHQSREEVTRRSGGNPLFAIELALSQGSENDAFQSIEGLITARIDRLGHGPRVLLRTASVLGEQFDLGLLRRLMGDRGMADMAALGQLLTIDGHWVRFRSRIIAEVAYGGLSAQRKRELHGEVAHRLEEIGADVTELAWHHGEAGNHERCWVYSRQAATRALEFGLVGEATEHLGRAVSAADQAGSVQVDPDAVTDALIQLFDAGEAAKSHDQALAAGRRAIGRLSDRGRRIELLVRVAMTTAEVDGSYSEQTANLQAELAACGPGVEDAEVRAWLGGTLASLQYRSDRADRALATAEAAVADAYAAGQIRAVPPALLIRHAALTDLADPRRTGVGEELIQAASKAADNRILATAYSNVGLDLQDGGQWARAADHYDRAMRHAEEIGDEYRRLFPTINLAALRVDQGRWDTARPVLDESRRVAKYHQSGFIEAWAQTELGRLEVCAGRTSAARPWLASALSWCIEAETETDLYEVRLLMLAADLADGRSDLVLEAAANLVAPDERVSRLAGKLDTILGYAHLQQGDPEHGLSHFDDAVEATEGSYLFGHALALVGRSEAEHFLGRGRSAKRTRDEADKILSGLDVTALPVIPLPK